MDNNFTKRFEDLKQSIESKKLNKAKLEQKKEQFLEEKEKNDVVLKELNVTKESIEQELEILRKQIEKELSKAEKIIE